MDDLIRTDDQLNRCLFFASAKLARVIGRTAEDKFKRTGLSPSHAFLLYIVNTNDGIHQKKIGEMLHMTPSTITRFVQSLESKELLSSKSDGKNAYIYSTEKGMLLQDDIIKAWESMHGIFEEILTPEEKDHFILTVNKLIGKLEEKR